MPAAALLVALTVLFAPATPARAERVFTSQAEFANALDTAWIPAPAQPAAVCIVDSGVDLNPDTSNVIARLAVDGGDPGDVSSQKHGTTMAMIATAPYNGWGMVGAAPSVRVVSVRAMTPGNEETFSPVDVSNAIRTCTSYRITYNVKVVSLSLGGQWGPGLDEASITLVEDAVDQARRYGLDVVAAAGNHPGPVDWPAAYGPVLAIGAASADGDRCSFAASGPRVDLWATGCPIQASTTEGQPATTVGSSGAAAFAAAALTQLRADRPDLTAAAAEDLLLRCSRSAAAGSSIDVSAAFVAAHLDSELSKGRAERAAVPGSTSAAVATPSGAPVITDEVAATFPSPSALRPRLVRPRIRARISHNAIAVLLRNKPSDATAIARVYARGKHQPFPKLARSLRTRGNTLRVRVSGAVTQLSILYRDSTGRQRDSTPLLVHFG